MSAALEKLTVLSLEQALSMSYATQRCVHLGWRVIRIESTPRARGRLPGDPNRYVGKPGEADDLRTYFVAPNVGKETISLDLKSPAGRDTLHRIIRDLPVDVFCSNTLPRRYAELGIDYETLSAIRPELIWVGLSAMGPDFPDAPGYDPALQALLGYMDLTGDSDGPPYLCGVPFVDLKAGDEAFAGICLALAELKTTGRGKRIDVSMAQAATSWLLTTLPLLDMGYEPSEVRRSGNRHREFSPVDAFPTRDGYIYLAIGNDVQWKRLVSLGEFKSLDREDWRTNAGRRKDLGPLCEEIAALTREHSTEDLWKLFGSSGLVAAPVHSIADVIEFGPIRDRLLKTVTPSGKTVRLPPPSVERAYLDAVDRTLPFAPTYGRDNSRILGEAGLAPEEIDVLRKEGVIT
jgi:crotonobetainyl-CoA:carnitine CoA-transferase CaiB-like acyl-CoA transferase